MLRWRSASRGRKSKVRARVHGAALPSAVGRGRDEVLAHREVGEDLAALGHQAEAEPGDAEGRQALDALASNSTMPRRAGSRPMMARTVVVLPMPLRPIRVTTSPASMPSSMPNSAWLAP